MLDYFQCLLDAGIITQQQYDNLFKFPPGEADLLRLVATLLMSQNNIENAARVVISSEELTVDSSTAAGLTTIPDDATGATITVHNDPILYTLDTSNPVSPDSGHYAVELTTFETSSLAGFVALSAGASSKLYITYWK